MKNAQAYPPPSYNLSCLKPVFPDSIQSFLDANYYVHSIGSIGPDQLGGGPPNECFCQT